jgi:protein TonB
MRKRSNLPLIIVGLGVTGIGIGAFAVIRNFVLGAPAQPKQVVQEIHLIRPPPPPPDQPPPPPPEEEKVAIQDPHQQPDPTPSNEPPPSANLGLDTEGGAGGDAFGLVGNKGGREITASGGNAFMWYANKLKDAILSELTDDKNVRTGNYKVTVHARVNEDGSLQVMEIVHGSGDVKRDRAIENDLRHLTRLGEARPAGMPADITFEVVARG